MAWKFNIFTGMLDYYTDVTVSGVAIKTAYEAELDTNAYDDAAVSKLGGIAAGATVNSTDATLLARTNHTGSQATSTITGLDATLASVVKNNAAGSNPGVSNDNTEGYTPGSAWVNTASDLAFVCVDTTTGAAVWVETTAGAGGGIASVAADLTPQAGGPFEMLGQIMKWSKGTDIADGAAITPTETGNYFDVLGATTATSIGTLGGNGTTIAPLIKLQFDAVRILTHGASLVLPGAANITTAIGDEAEFIEVSSGAWRCLNYSRADGTAVVSTNPFDQELSTTANVLFNSSRTSDGTHTPVSSVVSDATATHTTLTDTGTGYVCSATPEDTGIWVLYDKSTATASYIAGGVGRTLTYQFTGEDHFLTKIRMTSYTAPNNTLVPWNFTVHGSANGTDWDLLLTSPLTGSWATAAYQVLEMLVDAGTECYEYFKMVAAGYVYLSELEFVTVQKYNLSTGQTTALTPNIITSNAGTWFSLFSGTIGTSAYQTVATWDIFHTAVESPLFVRDLMITASNTANYNNYQPKDFTLSGSNTSVDGPWDLLLTVTGAQFTTQAEQQTWTIAENVRKGYKYHRFQFTANWVDSTTKALGQIDFLGTEVEYPHTEASSNGNYEITGDFSAGLAGAPAAARMDAAELTGTRPAIKGLRKSGTSTDTIAEFWGGTTPALAADIRVNGDFYNATYVYAQYSDERIKTDVVVKTAADLAATLTKYRQLQLVSFRSIAMPDLVQLGVVAQHTQTLFPGIVVESGKMITYFDDAWDIGDTWVEGPKETEADRPTITREILAVKSSILFGPKLAEAFLGADKEYCFRLDAIEARLSAGGIA